MRKAMLSAALATSLLAQGNLTTHDYVSGKNGLFARHEAKRGKGRGRKPHRPISQKKRRIQARRSSKKN